MLRKTTMMHLLVLSAAAMAAASHSRAQRACDVCPLEPQSARPAQPYTASAPLRACDVCSTRAEAQRGRIRLTELAVEKAD